MHLDPQVIEIQYAGVFVNTHTNGSQMIIYGIEFEFSSSSKSLIAILTASHAPVIEAVRVPPSARSTSQSIQSVLSGNFLRSTTARKNDPLTSGFQCPCRPFYPYCWSVFSRQRRVGEHVVFCREPSSFHFLLPHPSWYRSSIMAAHITCVSPNEHRTEPSA